MFSANAASNAPVPLRRNPRRRQRTSSDDAVKPPKAKRQRSTLRDDNHEAAVVDRRGDEHARALDIEPEGSAAGAPNRHVFNGLPFRGPKKTESHTSRAGVSTLLANNDFYSVSHLPSLPEQIRTNPRVPFRCIIAPESAYCLALTQDRAILWPYLSSSASLTQNDVLTFSLPNSSTNPNDPLPLATLISRSTAGDPGLVVVVPSTGKITFWETLSNAAILGLIKQKQNGIQGAIPGMLSGEYATDIINAEPAGVIVTLSSGRFAHVTVRDPQGKPAINAQFLRGMAHSSSGGIFGGIKNVLSGTPWRRRIVAARAGRSSQRGQRDIVVATSSGAIEMWDTHWNSGNHLKTQVDVKQAISRSLEEFNLASGDNNWASLQIVDFALRHESTDESAANDELSLWVLATMSRDDSLSYFIVGISVAESVPVPGPAYSVDYRNGSHDSVANWPPRIVVPRPGDTAFVIFEDGLALISLAISNESPSTQLMADIKSVPSTFRDSMRFRPGNDYTVLGYGVEDSPDSQTCSSCVIMVRNFGLFRVAALPRSVSEAGMENGEITTKSRLEQIVFYENVKTNPFDFTGYPELHTSPAALENAALEISDEILRSSSRFVAITVPSLDQQMKLRSLALQKLATFLKEADAELAYTTRWTLLWGAEKLAAQRAIWSVQESLEKDGSNKGTHLEYILGQMGEKFRTQLDASSGETDPVRHWFIHDTWRMEYIIPWILNGIRDANKSSSKVGQQFAVQIREASDLSLATLETAFQFREANAALYGLADKNTHTEVVSLPRYSELPEFWTSQSINYIETDQLLNAELNTCVQWMRQSASKTSASERKIGNVIKQLEGNIPRQFETLSQLYTERTLWCAAQSNQEAVEAGQSLQKLHIERRKPKLFKLAAIGLLEEAVELAEKFGDMRALVELMVDLRDQIKQRYAHPKAAGVAPTGLEDDLQNWHKRIDQYFERFGEEWADAFFTRQIVIGKPANLVVTREYQEPLTRFLRKRPGYAKVGWINEVVGEQDYNSASKALGNLALSQETDLWSKKVEVSLAKLAKLAVMQQEDQPPDVLAEIQADTELFDCHLDLSSIQETVYEHILPALHGAIDQSAELQLANEQFGKVLVDSKPALREALQRGLAKVVGRCPAEPDELIDLLTLMDPIQFLEGETNGVLGFEFTLALRVLKDSGFAKRDPSYWEILEKLIWRRCMIRDNWEIINTTNQKGDQEMESAIRGTALFRTLSEYADDLESLSETPSRLHTPSEIVNSTVYPHRLASRLLPEQRVHLSDDLDDENELLRTYVEKGRLDEWYSWIVSMTRASRTQVSVPEPIQEEEVTQGKEQ